MSSLVELKDDLVPVYLRHFEEALRGRDKTNVIESFSLACSHFRDRAASPSDLAEVDSKIAELAESLLNTEPDPKPARGPIRVSFRTLYYGFLLVLMFGGSLYLSLGGNAANPAPAGSEQGTGQ